MSPHRSTDLQCLWTRFLVIFGLLGLLALSACSTGRQQVRPVAPEAEPPAEWAHLEPAAVDSLPLLMPDWPTAPPGESCPTDWEALYREALASAAAGDPEPARDILFTLQELTTGYEPVAADSLYLEHRRSLQRRVVLLGGFLCDE